MALSVVRVLSLTTSRIEILFSDNLDENIGVANISITAALDNIDSPVVSSVEVEDNVLTINFRPLFPKVIYFITFSSTSDQSFQTTNGEVIFEDGDRNILQITSPGEEESEIRDNMLDSLSVVYETEQPSLVRDLVSSASDALQTASDVLATTKSANYISVEVTSESKTRGEGPTDKFDNGGAYEVLRVASTSSGSFRNRSIEFNSTRAATFQVRTNTIINSLVSSLPADPISLQSVDVINEQITDDIDEENFFSGLRIQVSKWPVIQVISVTLKRDGTYIPYDINKYGYTLQDNQYDTVAASRNVNLTNRQIDLSTNAITGEADAFVQPRAGDEIYISYVYKKLGRNINPSAVQVSNIKSVVRELTPGVAISFSLKNAPIVLANDTIPTTGGVSFLNAVAFDGNAPFTVAHPAFTNEIAFDVTQTPTRPGDYSVNYETGQVLVFGEDSTGTGTGSSPPVADYNYRNIFTNDIDYTFDSDTDDISARSISSIIGTDIKISFEYEDVFAEGIDFEFLSHIESLNERVNNRLISDFTVRTENYPITDAFRVFNETTGEIYTIERFNDTSIFFSGRKAPEQKDATRERVAFSREPQEVLLISETMTNSFGLTIYVINLSNSGITDSQRNFIGANFDNSILFSRADIFQEEKFYEDRLFDSVDQNIDRLTAIGEYSIDYSNGIIYVAVSSTQSSDLGDISYEYDDVLTRQDHILRVNNIYRSANATEDNITNFVVGNITDTTVNISNLNSVGERFINDDATRPLLVGSYQSGQDGISTNGSDLFSSNGATFTTDDVGRTLRVGSTTDLPIEDVTITGVVNTHQIVVSPALTETGSGRVWNILYLASGADKTITVAHNIISIRNIYKVSQLGSISASELDGYFDINRDSFENNVITLGSANPLDIGDAIIVVYNYGNVYIDYRYLKDDLMVSYEYGNNSLNWSISNALSKGEEYFVTYRYGAMRQPLLANFGALTQIPLLTNFPPDFDREIYRSVVAGTLQSFVEGPTIPSIERLVEAFTDVTPEITESVFDDWIVGRDYLHLRDIKATDTALFDLGKFNNGLQVSGDQCVTVPAVAHISEKEGTLEAWVRPEWDGLANDATLTFNLDMDGYEDIDKIYIGLSATNPSALPFSLSIGGDISVFGMPNNIGVDTGYFIWYDEFEKEWNIRWRENARESHSFNGTISSSGEFFNVTTPEIDGYEINEVSDLITSTINLITFNANIDCLDAIAAGDAYDGYIGSIDGGPFYNPSFDAIFDGGSFLDTIFYCTIDGGSFLDTEFTPNLTESVEAAIIAEDGITFLSGDEHYIFDLGARENANRMSLFKDGTGYLNFRVLDNNDSVGNKYELSTSIRDWLANELHHVAISWKFNSADDSDFMHLFVDGQEVPNLYKYGGKPSASSTDLYADIAEEEIISSASEPIIGGIDGATTASSNLFISQTTDFTASGVSIGNSLTILDDSADGEQDTITGGVYTITGVGVNSVTLDRSLTLTLGGVTFAVNQSVNTIETNVNFQDFIVVAIDSSGNETELAGVDADEPDYSVSRGTYGYHVLTINNGVDIGDRVVVRPLGLNFRRCKSKVFVYGEGDNEIRVNGPPPVSLQDVDITKFTMNTTLIEEGTLFQLISGSLFASFGGDGYHSELSDGYVFQDGYICQPSNTLNGRKLDVRLSGDNIDYSGSNNNRVRIIGTSVAGASEELLTFTENNIITTAEYWLNIVAVEVTIVPIDITVYAGIIEIKENKPINESDNAGDYAEVTKYSNGIFELEIYGSGGVEFNLESCYYEIDYPSLLKIDFMNMPDDFYLGSDINGSKQFDGIIDELRISKTAKTDTRTGETITSDSITADYVATNEFATSNDTLLLAHFNDNLNNSSNYIDSFDEGFQIDESVNDTFGTALFIPDNSPYVIDNALGVFNNDEGTIEFWVSPLEDSTKGDPNLHYYIDMTSSVVEEVESTTKITVLISQRASEIESVRLLTDTQNTGTNYFTGGSLSASDRKTITLGIALPSQNVPLKVSYTPLSSNGDRVSIYKDGSGFINFFVKANGTEHLISTYIDWSRNTWHRIMAMWTFNNTDNLDRMRLFVDGAERGTIKYGTGLIYGNGVLYGQSEVRPDQNRFLVTNIDLTDTFPKIYVGATTQSVLGARARIDNIRFSSIERLNAITVVSGETIDVNYTANTSLVQPVTSDLNTTLLLNFDKELAPVEFFTTLINSERGIFRFTVKVIDSFDKVIGNTTLEDLLVDLINTIKPAHTEATVVFVE